MEIKRSGSQPSGKGPEDYFSGSVRIDPLFQPPDPARAAAGSHVGPDPVREGEQTDLVAPDQGDVGQ